MGMKEIARQAGVSQGTASLVLNGKGDQYRIAAATQERIFEAARQLNYQPNISAKRLRSQGESVVPIIALFWTMDTRWELMGRFLKGVQAAVSKLETEHEIMIQPYVSSRLSEVKSLLTRTRFNGAIIANPTEEDEVYLEASDIPVPIVLFQRDSDKHSTVNVDNDESGRTVAGLLADRGHREAGLLVPNVSSRAVQLRRHGFLEECAARRLQVAESHTVLEDFSEEGGYRGVKRMAEGGCLPSALFCLSDQMAVGALSALHELGIAVPERMEVVGHDDFETAKYSIPPLTTIHLPVEEMAASSVRLLADLMSRKASPPLSAQFEHRLVIRQSCGSEQEKWSRANSQ